MGNMKDQHQDHKTEAREELRSRSVGVLLQIIDELGKMDLSVREIETILKTCGLNADCAVSFGEKIKFEKEKGHFHKDSPMHP